MILAGCSADHGCTGRRTSVQVPAEAGCKERRLIPLFCSHRENKHVQTRTRHFVAYFSAPFRLGGLEGVQPAGAYALDQQEELDHQEEEIAGSCSSDRRMVMFMHLPAVLNGRWTLCQVRVDPAEIGTAILHELEQDPDRNDVARREIEG